MLRAGALRGQRKSKSTNKRQSAALFRREPLPLLKRGAYHLFADILRVGRADIRFPDDSKRIHELDSGAAYRLRQAKIKACVGGGAGAEYRHYRRVQVRGFPRGNAEPHRAFYPQPGNSTAYRYQLFHVPVYLLHH